MLTTTIIRRMMVILKREPRERKMSFHIDSVTTTPTPIIKVCAELSEAISLHQGAIVKKTKIEKRLEKLEDLDGFEKLIEQTVKVHHKGAHMYMDAKLTMKDFDYSKTAPFVYYNSTSRSFVFDKRDIPADRLPKRWYRAAVIKKDGKIVAQAGVRDIIKAVKRHYNELLDAAEIKVKETRAALELELQNQIVTIVEVPRKAA